MARYAKLFRAPAIPQSSPLKPNQAKNNAGGYVFTIDDWSRLDRFLILGSDSNTYYQKAPELTRENARCVERCFDANSERTVQRIVEVSMNALAPKNDPAIYALAIGACHKDVRTRQRALVALGSVCRTATHLFQFRANVEALGRGWGRALKRAFARWYEDRSPASLALQVVKYRSREGFDHKRTIRMCHPKAITEQHGHIYDWVCGRPLHENAPEIISGHVAAMQEDISRQIPGIIKRYGLPWETIHTSYKKDPAVWRAMLDLEGGASMGMTAMIRNLGAMTACEAIKPLSKEAKVICARLADPLELKDARLHPFGILLGLTAYKGGQSIAGAGRLNRRGEKREGLSWEPIKNIVDALDDAFYLSFANIEPTGKRILVALDVSGSMTGSMSGTHLTVREAAAAMAMATMRTEERHHVIGFTSAGKNTYADSRRGWYSQNNSVSELDISPKMRLDQVVRETSGLPFGATDCALPMLYAASRDLDVDAFIIYTDNETWAGAIHPVQALNDYRVKTGINAKLVVVGMTSTGFSIADPNDAGMMDVVGFDASAPAIIANFIAN